MSYWKVWYSRRGKVKGLAIVFQAADIGLELRSDLWQESDREHLCQELCDKLNKAEGRYAPPPVSHSHELREEGGA